MDEELGFSSSSASDVPSVGFALCRGFFVDVFTCGLGEIVIFLFREGGDRLGEDFDSSGVFDFVLGLLCVASSEVVWVSEHCLDPFHIRVCI